MFKDRLCVVLPSERFFEVAVFYGETLGLAALPAQQPEAGRSALFKAGRTGMVKVTDAAPGLPAGPTAIWIEASCVDEVYELVKARGNVRFLAELGDVYYHAREFQTLDADGNIACIINYEKDLAARRAAGLQGGVCADEFRAVLYVKNLAACHRFYTEALGLADVYHWREHEGDRGFKFQLCEGSHSFIEILFREPKSTQRQAVMELWAEDIEAAFARAASHPDTMVLSPLQKGTGGLSFTLADPDGNALRIFHSHTSAFSDTH